MACNRRPRPRIPRLNHAVNQDYAVSKVYKRLPDKDHIVKTITLKREISPRSLSSFLYTHTRLRQQKESSKSQAVAKKHQKLCFFRYFFISFAPSIAIKQNHETPRKILQTLQLAEIQLVYLCLPISIKEQRHSKHRLWRSSNKFTYHRRAIDKNSLKLQSQNFMVMGLLMP